MAGKVERGGNGVIGAEAATIVAHQPYGIAQQQQGRAGETGQRGVGGAGEPQLTGQPDHHQRHSDKGQHRHFHLFQPTPDHRHQQGAEYQQHQRQRPEERQRQLAGEPDGIQQM